MIRSFLCVALVAIVSPSISDVAFAGDADWPQWRGPNRDGHAAEQSLMQSWPEGGPALTFQFNDAGRGYSALAIVDGEIFTMGADDQNTFALCIDIADGSEKWRTNFSTTGVDGDYNLGWGGGPRGTPTVDGDDVFVLSDVGVLASLNRKTGQEQWSVDLVKDYGGKIPTWGYSESILIDGDNVVCMPGEKNFLVGFDRSTGRQTWQSSGIDAPAQYASLVKGTAGGEAYYAAVSKPGLYGVKVADGTQTFFEEGTGNNVAVIPTPIILKDGVYHTSDYGSGCVLVKFADDGSPNLIYHLEDKTMRNHHGGVVLVDGVIYGFTKANGGAWMAQDLETGEVLWQERIRPNKSGSIAYADGRLYCYNDKDGECYLVVPDRDRWQSTGKVALPRETSIPRDRGAIWAHPVIADGKLFIRDQDLIFGFDIAR